MSIFKKIITILLSFILMIGIISSTFLVIANTFLQKDNMLKKFEEINLYNSVYEEVRNGFENYIYQSGLDISIIDKICTKEKVKNDVNTVLQAMYGEGDSAIDSIEIRTNLDNAIKEYVESQGRKLSNEEEENIQKFEDLIEESYKEEIGLYQKGSDKIARSLPQVLSTIRKAEIVSVGITTLILIILIIVNGKKVSIAGSFVGTAMLASGAVLLITKNIITSKFDIDHLILFTQSLSGAIISLAHSILDSIQTFGIWYIVIGIILIIIMNVFSVNEKKS